MSQTYDGIATKSMMDVEQCIAEDVCRICEDLGQIRRELVASHAKKASDDC